MLSFSGGWPRFAGASHFFAPGLAKRGEQMVTYAELFQYTLVLIGLAALIIQWTKKEVTAWLVPRRLLI